MYLYDVSPSLIETFCKIIDTGDDSLGWRGLGERPHFLSFFVKFKIALTDG